ncbi:organic solute transporter alpha-like protein [Anabrus simplex]|uniref:organic solute transporter alpha-like protein n=1 Tax=Anabrus simplex TaxID=316456 RepID=UPI0035A347ED
MEGFITNSSTYGEGFDEVIARHLGGSKLMRSLTEALRPNSSSVLNNTSLCKVDVVPSLHDYYKAINVAGITLFSCGAAGVVLILFLYIDTLRHIIRNAPSPVKTHSAFVLGVYPVVALATYCAIIVPRAHLLSEAVTQGMFMASMYQLFCLLVAYCGGEAELIRRVKPDSLNPRVGPCCCWPCCCLPLCSVNKRNVRQLRLLVLQLPVVQGLVYMVLLVMWAEEESLYHVNYMYFQPVVVCSILFGIWGISMTMKMLAEVLKDHHMQAKFMVLQMVLLLAKLQGLLARISVWSGLMPCKPPITPSVYGNLIYNTTMLGEMVILMILARLLYKKEMPQLGLADNKDPRLQEIFTIVDKLPRTLEKIIMKEQITNGTLKPLPSPESDGDQRRM